MLELRGRFQTQASAWTTGPIRLRQGGMGLSFSEKSGSPSRIFRKKTEKVRCCRRRNTPLSRANGPFERPPRKSCKIQDLRGGVCSGLVPAPNTGFASRRVELTISFSRTFGSPSQMFVKKTEKVQCCRRRIGASSDQTPGVYAHRVTRVKYRSYAVPDPQENCASGRAEDSDLFHKNSHEMQAFCEKDKTVPRCRRRDRLPSNQTFGLNVHRISPVKYWTSGI